MPRQQQPSRTSKRDLAGAGDTDRISLAMETQTKKSASPEQAQIKLYLDQIGEEAEKLTDIQAAGNSRLSQKQQLDDISEQDESDKDSSGEYDYPDSHETVPYGNHKEYSNLPLLSPNLRSQPPLNTGAQPPFNTGALNFVPNPAQHNPIQPQTPNVAVATLDPMAFLQTFMVNQADTNRQLQQLLVSSMDKQTNQQAAALFKQNIKEAKDAIKPLKDNINICLYFDHFEAELTEASVPKAKWKKILISKLSPKAEKKCAHLIANRATTYSALRDHLKRQLGQTREELCNLIHGASYQEFRDKTETEKLQHAKYLAERYLLDVSPEKVTDHIAIYLYKYHCDRRFAHSLKLSKNHTLDDVLELTASFDSHIEYEKTRADRYQPSRPRSNTKPTCTYCKKVGHNESDCYRKQNDLKQDTKPDKLPFKPKYQDHRRPYGSKDNYKDTGVKTRPATVNWNQTYTTDGVIKGQVNNQDVDIVVDTGAQITVVRGKFVYTDNLTGNTVSILGINGDPVPYQTAIVPIKLKGKTVLETVAIAPTDQLNDKVLLSTPVDTSAVNFLVDSYLSVKNTSDDETTEPLIVHQVIQNKNAARPKRAANTTKNYFPVDEQSFHEDDKASDLSYNPDSDSEVSSVSDFSDSDNDMPRHEQPGQPSAPMSIQAEPSVKTLQSIQAEPLSDPKQADLPDPTVIDQTPTTPDSEPFQLPNFPVLNSPSTLTAFKEAIKSDPSLKAIRGLAHHDRNGYAWSNGLLVHNILDPTLGERKRLVVPKPFQENLIAIAHDRSGHFANSKTRSVLNHRFTWPNMGSDITEYILACSHCKRFNKSAHKPAPLQYRPTITEPYQEVALDLIGPLPRAKHGFKFALTLICMASRWPEVYPIAKPDTEHVAQALIQFIARNGIPVKILTDQGPQFMAKAISQTCNLLGITHIKTVPYRPQGNGVIERFHGTLKPLLSKASDDDFDWPSFLPLALSAIRSVPCRSTGFSPAELVFGRNPRNLLDVVYEGWSNPSYMSVDIPTWVEQLQDKLEILRDSAAFNNHIAKLKQNASKNKHR